MRQKVYLRFYEELNDYLPREKRKVFFPHRFENGSTVEDVLKTFGVPLEAIDLVLINGHSVDFFQRLNNGDRISIYPVFEAFDIGPEMKVRTRPLRRPRFALDIRMGRLAAYLRMLGFDTLYDKDYKYKDLITLSQEQERILLSKDPSLVQQDRLSRAYLMRSTTPRQQLAEVLSHFDLFALVRPLGRCICCNTPLEPVRKREVIFRLPSKISERYDEFRLCPTCTRIYWKGIYYRHLERFVQNVMEGGADKP